jgi:hypothetical protein
MIKIFFFPILRTLTTVRTCNHISKADQRTKEKIPTGNEWMPEEVTRNAESRITYYKRGKENATVKNYDAGGSSLIITELIGISLIAIQIIL